MSNYMLTLFFVALFLVHVPAGYGLRCWSCNTDRNENCALPSTGIGIPIEICKSQFYADAKFVCRRVETYTKRDNRLQVTRACAEERDQSGYEACSQIRLVAFGGVRNCSTCTTDLCRPEAFGTIPSKSKDPDTRFSPPTSKPYVPYVPNVPPRTYYNNPPPRTNYYDDYATPKKSDATSVWFQNTIFLTLAFVTVLRKTL